MKINKIIVPFAIIIILLSSASFYGGIKYSESKIPVRTAGQFRNNPTGNTTIRNRTGGQNGGGMVSGEILSLDDKSITVKDRSGGSKIIYLGATSEILKSTKGTLSDLAIGINIISNGIPNTDGSITATSIQIRPNGQNLQVPKNN